MRNIHSFIKFEEGWTTNVPKTLKSMFKNKKSKADYMYDLSINLDEIIVL